MPDHIHFPNCETKRGLSKIFRKQVENGTNGPDRFYGPRGHDDIGRARVCKPLPYVTRSTREPDEQQNRHKFFAGLSRHRAPTVRNPVCWSSLVEPDVFGNRNPKTTERSTEYGPRAGATRIAIPIDQTSGRWNAVSRFLPGVVGRRFSFFPHIVSRSL